ncbi:MAG TPA: hypothetical protein GX015_02595, partial [Corynebacterium sp.]|nr:hypothetical protein [Corynebacterium sp.]
MTRRDDADPRTPDEPTELGRGQEPTDAVDPANPEATDAAPADAISADDVAADEVTADGESAEDDAADTRSMKTVPPALWVWFAALLLLVG